MESHTLSPRRQLYDKGLRVVLYFCGFLTCALLVLIIGYIFYRGVPFISWAYSCNTLLRLQPPQARQSTDKSILFFVRFHLPSYDPTPFHCIFQ